MKKAVDTSVQVDTSVVGVKVDAVSASAASDFPDATNTGVVAGTKMTVFNGTYYVTKDNAVVSNLEVHGDIVIQAKNVTLSNIKLVSETPWHALRVMDDATGFTLKDSEIDGGGSTVNAIYGFGTFLRNNLHDVENGINTIGPVDFRDNYIHDLNGGPDAHFDGIENNGSPDMNVVHNTIVNEHDQTSAVMLNNEFGSLSNINIEDNRLVGGGYTVYLDGRKGGGTVDDGSIKIVNNQIGDGYWGNYAFYDDKPVVSGNVGLDESVPTTPTNPTTPTQPTTPQPIVYMGTAGDDTMPLVGKVSTGNETYNGMAGNDLMEGGKGADTINGGSGIDTASYMHSSAGVNIDLAPQVAASASLLAAGVTVGTATTSGGDAAGDKLTSIENLMGSIFADTLEGNAGSNRLNGWAGADKLIGGAGNDTYVVDNTGDKVVENVGGGNDVVNAWVSTTLSANVEGLVLSGTNAINGTGNSGNNGIYGNSANNSINGGAGNDYLRGNGGADILTGGAGADTFAFRQADVKIAGADHITDFTSGDIIGFDVTGKTGAIDPTTFVTGTNALDASDRFIFDASSHSLYYDADGNGAGAKTLLATFDNGYNVTAHDIMLI